MRTLLRIILTIVTLAAMGWAVWQGILLLRQEQLGLAPGTRPVMIIVAILCIISVFMITMSIDSHGRHVYASRQFEARYVLYERCIGVFQALLRELPAEGSLQMDLQFTDMDLQLALLASTKVLKAFAELKLVTAAKGLNTEAGREARQRLVLAMRDDLGVEADALVKKYLFQTSENK
jgi:hypothetical protein